MRIWSTAPGRGVRLYVSVWVSVGLPSCLDRALVHESPEKSECGVHGIVNKSLTINWSDRENSQSFKSHWGRKLSVKSE
jgi:hypothetical protein